MKHVVAEIMVHDDKMLPLFLEALTDAVWAGQPTRIDTQAGTADMMDVDTGTRRPIAVRMERGRCLAEVQKLAKSIEERKLDAMRKREDAITAGQPSDAYLHGIQTLTTLQADVSAVLCEIEEPEMAKA